MSAWTLPTLILNILSTGELALLVANMGWFVYPSPKSSTVTTHFTDQFYEAIAPKEVAV